MVPSKKKRKIEQYPGISIFDVDGTLVDGFLLFDFARFLVRDNKFAKRAFSSLRYTTEEFRRSYEGELEPTQQEELTRFEQYAGELLLKFGEGIVGCTRSELDYTADQFIRHSDRFPFTKGLVRVVREYGYQPVLISGGPSIIIRAFGKSLGINSKHIFSTHYHTDSENRYTGMILESVATHATKKRHAGNTIKEKKIPKESTAGFGDSLLDIGFLEQTKHNFVIRPRGSLRKVAEERKWTICDRDEYVIGLVKYYLPKLSK